MTDSFAPKKTIIATQTVIVHDDALNIDRQVIKGLPVPPDLVDAYEAATGEKAETPRERVAADKAADKTAQSRGAKSTG